MRRWLTAHIFFLFAFLPPWASVTYFQKTASLIWDSTTLTRISPPGGTGSYPRMVQLNNGFLLAAYASNGNVVTVTSTNTGTTWSAPVVVAPGRDSINMDTPDLLQLKNGTLLLCYATRPQTALRGRPDPLKKFEIRVQKSSDNGVSWKDEKILYRAGASFKDGCWEPAMLQTPSGDIQLFFSNEGVYPGSNEQNISMLRSTDNGSSWSTNPQIISFRKGSRDGMPVPVWLKNEKKIAVAIEDPGHGSFKPYIIRSSANGGWEKIISGEDKDRMYALRHAVTDSVYAGAPYLRLLSTGETILSYQSTVGRIRNMDNNAVMRVATGDKGAKNFDGVTTPFSIPEGYHALWNSLCVLHDDTIIAVTSTNGYSKAGPEIWMIKGHVKRPG